MTADANAPPAFHAAMLAANWKPQRNRRGAIAWWTHNRTWRRVTDDDAYRRWRECGETPVPV